MEDIKKPITSDLSYVILYLGDIEKIVKILEEAESTEILLTADNKLFKPKEINELKIEKLDYLDIAASFSDYTSFNISFDKRGTHIWCHKNNAQTQGITRQIEDFLKGKIRLFGSLAKSDINAMILGAVVSIFILPVIILKQDFSLLNIVILCSIFFFVVYISGFYKNIIFIKPKKYYKNFFVRNKDQLLVGIILSIIAFLLGRYSK